MRKPITIHDKGYTALTIITLEITEEKKREAQKVSNILKVGYLYSFRQKLKGNQQQPPVQINMILLKTLALTVLALQSDYKPVPNLPPVTILSSQWRRSSFYTIPFHMKYDDLTLWSQRILRSLQSNYEGSTSHSLLSITYYANRVETSPTALHKTSSQQNVFHSLSSISIQDVGTETKFWRI